METARLLAATLPWVLLGTGCAPKRVAAPPPPPPPPKQNLIVLLPDAAGAVGSIVVTNAGGAQELKQPYTAVRVERSDVAPTAPFALNEAEVRRVFGSTLDVLPPAEQLFTLYFQLDRDELRPESAAELPAVFRAIRERRSTDVSVTGHTDTTGTSASNYELGLKRAQQVAEILRSMGADPSILTVSSHGETDLLVKTADGTAEPRNRRVEVIVR